MIFMQQMAISFGFFFLTAVEFFGGTAILLKKSIREMSSRPYYPRLIVDQVGQLGVNSLSIVLACALSTGMVMSLQFGLGLEKFGGKMYVPKIVSLSIARELAPVFTSLMIAGRVGAGIASEIGSMVVTQQIDAIRALGTSPLKKIVIPRILATLISLPVLTVLSNVLGITGALIVGVLELHLDAMFFFQKIVTTVTALDFAVGVLKTFFFALFISVTACYFGLNVKEGTRGVGRATTEAVVVGSILIVVSNFFLTKLFWILIEK